MGDSVSPTVGRKSNDNKAAGVLDYRHGVLSMIELIKTSPVIHRVVLFLVNETGHLFLGAG